MVGTLRVGIGMDVGVGRMRVRDSLGGLVEAAGSSRRGAGTRQMVRLRSGRQVVAVWVVVCLEARQWRSGRLVGVRFGLQVRDGRKMECMGLR